MGHAYEQYTATYLKKKKGQFFTNRLVVDFMVAVFDPSYQDIILDPAGGSGGFLTGVMRYVRKKILSGDGTNISKQRQLDRHRTRLFMVEISKRLVKIAKTAMILNGDGHTGMTQGDSLGPFEELNENVIAIAGKGKPTIILTNPPFAGVGEGRITDRNVLNNFSSGIRWTTRGGEYKPTGELTSEGVPPEMLFFERCLQWIAPGGKVGIVITNSNIHNNTYFNLRNIILQEFKLIGVINCHKDTFQPHTGVRTCLVFVEKPKDPNVLREDYSIFMAISKKIGQDSEGFPIFKRDKDNNLMDQLDHDFGDIISDFNSFKNKSLVPSEYRFSIKRSDIDKQLRINPQVHLPNLNKTIRQIESIDGINGWSVTTIGQIAKDVKIFKGPRLKTENLIVDELDTYVEPYYTPSAVLQEKSESAKLLDLSKATESQKKTIDAVRVKRGDIVITRSGTIGRVAYITKRLHNSIASDDLIRVRINDEYKRFYIFAFLQSFAALDQMLRNEYGSVQQHLEPHHVSGILIPIPKKWDEVKGLVKNIRKIINTKEKLEALTQQSELEERDFLEQLINRAEESLKEDG